MMNMVINMKKNEKKAWIIIALVIILVSALYIILEIRKYYHPEVYINIASIKKGSNQLQFATIAYHENSIFGENIQFEDKINGISFENSAIRTEIELEYNFPGIVNCNVEEKYDGMYIKYSGYMTDKNNNTIEIDKEVKVDVKIDEVIYE